MTGQMTEIVFNERTGEFEEVEPGFRLFRKRRAGGKILQQTLSIPRRAADLLLSATRKACRMITWVIRLLVRLAVFALVVMAAYWAYSNYAKDFNWDSLRFWRQGEHLSMTGKVSRYPVRMELNLNGQEVKGFYYYTSQGSEHCLQLEGTAEGSHLRLKEADENGRTTGHFDGILNDNTFSGRFEGQKKKKMTFKVRINQPRDRLAQDGLL